MAEMGILECRFCGAKAEADTIKAADDLIDHARGKAIGRPCPGEPSELLWDGKQAFRKEYVLLIKESPAKAKASKANKPKPKPKPTTTTITQEDDSSKTAL